MIGENSTAKTDPRRPRLSERCLARLHFVDGKCRVMLHDVETGDVIEITESKPISKTKNWVVTRLVEKAAEV